MVTLSVTPDGVALADPEVRTVYLASEADAVIAGLREEMAQSQQDRNQAQVAEERYRSENEDLRAELAAAKHETDRAHALLIPMVDIGQRRLNGGPYCVHVEGDGFCGRAERWAGHSDKPEDFPGHPFKDGEWLAKLAIDSSIAAVSGEG